MRLSFRLIYVYYIIIEADENEKPRPEVQNDLKEVEIDFAQLRDQ
jgi:hypothetical protein